MKTGESSAIPKETFSYLLFCALGVLAFLLLAIYPSHRSIADLDRKIAEAKDRLEEQKILLPLYAELLAKSKTKGAEALQPEAKSGLMQDQIDKISVLLGDVARKSNIETVSVTPDVKSLTGGSALLTVHVVARGNFFSLRQFMLELESLPYMDRMEEIHVQDVSGNKEFKFKMKLAVNKK